MSERLYAVVPAGGSGTRLWPLSRRDEPKFLHALAGGDRSLLQATVDRLTPMVPAENTFVVTGGSHQPKVQAQLPELPPHNVLVEPAPRNSAPAIGLAAAVIARRDPSAVMGSYAADHVVPDDEAFRAAVRDAVTVAEQGYLVTIGITPTYPATGFGWIQRGEPLDGVGELVAEFTEKPSADVAARYLAGGRSLWNASMFVWQVSAFLDELRRQLPELHDGLARIADAWDGPQRDAVLAEVWPGLAAESVDDGVLVDAARRGRVAVVPGTFEWHDIGDWNGLAELLGGDADGNVDLGGGERLSVGDTGTLVAASGGRLVATLGLTDVVVVDTPDAVLVAPRDRAQEVRGLVEELKARGDGRYL